MEIHISNIQCRGLDLRCSTAFNVSGFSFCTDQKVYGISGGIENLLDENKRLENELASVEQENQEFQVCGSVIVQESQLNNI